MATVEVQVVTRGTHIDEETSCSPGATDKIYDEGGGVILHNTVREMF